MLIRALLSFTLLLPLCLHAEPYIPSDDTVIAKTTITKNAVLDSTTLMNLLTLSQQVGKTQQNQGILKAQLKARYSQSASADIGYMYARVLQREHLFSKALTITQDILNKHPEHVNTHLLRANMLMVQGQFSKAKEQCLKLITLTAIDVVNTCVFDVLSQDGQLAQSYKSLKNSIQPDKQTDATRHVLAEMAYRLDKPQQALQHINTISLKTSPVSLVVLWADIQLKLKNYDRVLNSLPKLTTDKQRLEDALLLRLAIAEHKSVNTQQTQWQDNITTRVNLRELRKDIFHASDIALYYLEINKQADKALYWAKLNWQQAKLDADQQLLMRAQGASL